MDSEHNTSDNKLLSAPLRDALKNERKLEAIKLLRESMGMGLKEAKDFVDVYSGTEGPTEESLRAETAYAADAISKGNVREALNRLRKSTGMSLKEARESVGPLPESRKNNKARTTIDIALSHLAAGWIIVLIVAGMLIWYYFKTS